MRKAVAFPSLHGIPAVLNPFRHGGRKAVPPNLKKFTAIIILTENQLDTKGIPFNYFT